MYGRLPKELREYDANGIELIALIVKAIYGLPVAGQEWNREINGYLTTPRADGGMGFKRAPGDPCLYSWRDGDQWAIIGLSTDNAWHLESSDAVHDEVIRLLKAKYEWIDEGAISDLPAALGTKTTQDLAAGTVTISLEGYIEALADKFSAHIGSKRVQTPATQDLEKHVTEAILTKGDPRDADDIKWFQRLVGALLFASIVCRPDISWATAMLSRAMCYPTAALKADAVRVLNYLYQHKSLCLTYSKNKFFSAFSGTVEECDAVMGGLSGAESFTMEGFSDSDFAAGPSMSGWAWRKAGAVVSYGSKRQSGTMLDTASAELYAGSVAATHGVYLRNIDAEVGWPPLGASRLYIDNQATVALAHNPMSFQKVKHIARRHHYLRECVENNELMVKHISTAYNIADIFTKALEPKKIKLFRAALMNLSPETLE